MEFRPEKAVPINGSQRKENQAYNLDERIEIQRGYPVVFAMGCNASFFFTVCLIFAWVRSRISEDFNNEQAETRLPIPRFGLFLSP